MIGCKGFKSPHLCFLCRRGRVSFGSEGAGDLHSSSTNIEGEELSEVSELIVAVMVPVSDSEVLESADGFFLAHMENENGCCFLLILIN